MLDMMDNRSNSAATEMTTFAWKYLPNAGLVVRHGDDHVSFDCKSNMKSTNQEMSPHANARLLPSVPQQQSTCITKQFLRTGQLPPTRNDTFVTVYEPGM